MPSKQELKNKIRKEYLEKRLSVSKEERKESALRSYRLFFNNINIKEKAVIAGYWPIKAELDILPILKELLNKGHICLLPHVDAVDKPLIFRKWDNNTPMEYGRFNIKEPLIDNVLEPDIILVPLLAFDSNCSRLGYGGGYYDRTIANFKKNKSVFTIGMAYEEQLCDYIPIESTDISMDIIITDKKIYNLEG